VYIAKKNATVKIQVSNTRWLLKIMAEFTNETVSQHYQTVHQLQCQIQNSKNLRLNGHTSFEFHTRYYITCFGLMYFCVWFSWPWGWLQMWPKHVM